jgi:hypothetical protein
MENKSRIRKEDESRKRNKMSEGNENKEEENE